ncbi:MAG: acyltransferase [Candidatus Altiarchaeota archaeon]
MANICPVPGFRVFLHKLRGVKIGKNCFVGNNVLLDRIFPHLITFEDYAEIGDNSVITCHGRGSKPLRKAYPVKIEPVVIGKGVWMGVNCIVLSGVTVGEYCIVGAGSVVTKNVPPYTVVAGNPAKKIGSIRKEDIIQV